MYLFIRVLEACNAGCFMCEFRNSKDEYRLTKDEYIKIIKQSKEDGLKYVRFTGGEPLKHSNIIEFISIAKELNVKTSIISNGYYLPDKAISLKNVGLDQIIVSIDGASASTHDRFRNTKGLFDKSIEGLKISKDLGISTRVNTVAGPHNYLELIDVQQLITELKVEQWELSALKLDRPVKYSTEARKKIISDLNVLYESGPAQGLLKPKGGVFWCGRDESEQTQFFESNIPPRPVGVCNLVHNMRYYDAKNKYLFPCSLLPHRVDKKRTCTKIWDKFELMGEEIVESANYYSENGPNLCRGCSTTAAGFLDTGQDWDF